MARRRPTHLPTAGVFAVLAAICGGVAYDGAVEAAFTMDSVWDDPQVSLCAAGAGCFALLAAFFAALWELDPRERYQRKAPPTEPNPTSEAIPETSAEDDLAARHANITERIAADLAGEAQTPQPKADHDK